MAEAKTKKPAEAKTVVKKTTPKKRNTEVRLLDYHLMRRIENDAHDVYAEFITQREGFAKAAKCIRTRRSMREIEKIFRDMHMEMKITIPNLGVYHAELVDISFSREPFPDRSIASVYKIKLTRFCTSENGVVEIPYSPCYSDGYGDNMYAVVSSICNELKDAISEQAFRDYHELPEEDQGLDNIESAEYFTKIVK